MLVSANICLLNTGLFPQPISLPTKGVFNDHSNLILPTLIKKSYQAIQHFVIVATMPYIMMYLQLYTSV